MGVSIIPYTSTRLKITLETLPQYVFVLRVVNQVLH